VLIDPDPRPTFGVKAIMHAIEGLARQRGIGANARVLYKQNSRGEHVIALICPQQTRAGP
jgi:hypothetical protein